MKVSGLAIPTDNKREMQEIFTLAMDEIVGRGIKETSFVLYFASLKNRKVSQIWVVCPIEEC